MCTWYCLFQGLLTKPFLKGSQLVYQFLTTEKAFDFGFDIKIGEYEYLFSRYLIGNKHLVVKVPVCTSNYLYVVQVIQIKIATHDPMRHYSLLKQHKLTQNRWKPPWPIDSYHVVNGAYLYPPFIIVLLYYLFPREWGQRE